MPRRLFSVKVRDNIIFDISHVLVARKATLHKNYPLPKFWLNFQVTTSPVLGVSPHPLPAYSRHFRAVFDSRSLLLNRTAETLATQANQAPSSLASAGFQNPGVCLASVSSLALPLPPLSFFWLSFHFSRGQNRKSPSPVFQFFAPKPNGTLATQASSPVFPDGIFQTEIRVPLLQSHLSFSGLIRTW